MNAADMRVMWRDSSALCFSLLPPPKGVNTKYGVVTFWGARVCSWALHAHRLDSSADKADKGRGACAVVAHAASPPTCPPPLPT